MATYPFEHECPNRQGAGALIIQVEPETPADDAGFTPGCTITAVNGKPLTDILLWQWESADEEIALHYVDTDGDEGDVELCREGDEPWGFAFDGAIFDGVRQCRNACTFCFMRQLPQGLRPSLTLRDDDYRLSFLDGTFVTFTNMAEADERRIIDQHLWPLRLSLHAVDADVRQSLIGRHAAHGFESLCRLLDAGVEFCAQIVLVPGVNDGEVLKRTLEWCAARPGILEVGIVPLGYTRYQDRFDHSFQDPQAAQAVLDVIGAYEQQALASRGFPWVYAADEFYLNAYGDEVIDHLPPAKFYGSFAMYEDGVGIVRSFIDDFAGCQESGEVQACADALRESGVRVVMVVGEAPRPYASRLFAQSALAPYVDVLFAANEFFGGNVTVTGLLCGTDMVNALAQYRERQAHAWDKTVFCIPSVVFNDDGLTLDGYTLSDMEERLGVPLQVVASTVSGFLPFIRAYAQGKRKA